MPSVADLPVEPRFEPPPQFAVIDRRMAAAARDLWQQSGGMRVDAFADHALVIADPAGTAMITNAGIAIEAVFGLSVGMRLDGLTGLAAEVRAACDLIVFDPRPVPFEASLAGVGRACVLARGIALPLFDGLDTSKIPDKVQVILNWRELLDHSATTRLRREIGDALRLSRPNPAKIDPFMLKTSRKLFR